LYQTKGTDKIIKRIFFGVVFVYRRKIMKNTITLKLNGDIMLAEFSKVMNHLTTLINTLTTEVGENAEIEWEISKLESGSAGAEIIGKSQDELSVNKVVEAYEVIGKAITENNPIPYNEKIANEARSITSVINGKITSIEMRTQEFETTIDHAIEEKDVEKDKGFSYGTITGLVETLSKRRRMRFVLYDSLFDRAVNCYLKEGQEHLLLDAWDKRVTVAGKVYRDAETGRPYEVRDINYIENKEPSQPGIFMNVEGLIPWKMGDEYPEEVIRRYRDAQ
jgi:hypothetical protein